MSGRSRAIADTLCRAIMDHRLIPGCKLGERELAEIFDVSRTVVRQALIRLADEGLVEIEHHRGAFVARPSMRDAMEIYDALTVIEQGIATQLSERLGPVGWAELRRHVERQRLSVEADNTALADELGQDFHQVLVRLSGNKVMQEIHAQLLRRTTLLRSLVTADFDYCHLLDDHSRIIDLLEKRRIKQALELIDAHYRAVARAYILDHAVFPEFTVADALSPYLSAAGAPSPQASEKKVVALPTAERRHAGSGSRDRSKRATPAEGRR